LIWPSSFSCTSAALIAECEAATYKSNGALVKVELVLLDRSSIASTLRKLFAKPDPIEKLRLTLEFQRMVNSSSLILI
jgi:hypothetical protein